MIKAKNLKPGEIFIYFNQCTKIYDNCCRILIDDEKSTEVPVINLSYPDSIWHLLPDQEVCN